ncbi:MAG: aromatic-ring-hydroxylating dioxygenase subunit beta [Betaproteobacteria bacterium]
MDGSLMRHERNDAADLVRQVEDFVQREAQLLDERSFEAWLALFDEGGWYWMPASPSQSSPESALSLLYEDKRLLAVRVRRLAHPAVLVESPPTRSHHHVSTIRVERAEDGTLRSFSAQLIALFRDNEQQLLSARVTHHLKTDPGGLLIVSKTVSLLDCDAPRRGFAVPL